MQLIKDTHIDFIGKSKMAISISVILILAGIVSLIIQGGPKLGIDFTGGTSLQFKFEKPIKIGEIRNILSGINLGDIEIKEFATQNEVLIRIPQQSASENISQKVITELSSKISDNKLEVRMNEEVGPRIGSELRRATIWAILISLILLLIYISFRFEFKFALGAVVALFHDVMVTLSFFSWLKLDISLDVIAAFLTIIGYSLNDTIVIFDRVRENLKILRREEYINIFNVSINQTLSRTILTSLTVFIVVIILFLFGGEVIHNFSFAMVVGVIAGTYSTVFIACPIAIYWHKKKESAKRIGR